MDADAAKSSIQDQFNRCSQYYLQGSPMGDRELLRQIVHLAQPRCSDHILDVCCGAGLLLRELAPLVEQAVGVDISQAMLAAAKQATADLPNVHLMLADAEALPFADGTFDLVACKLALRYFPEPDRAMREMQRAAKHDATLLIVDRIASDDPRARELQNRMEKLRTPSKTRVYCRSEIAEMIGRAGLSIVHEEHYEQHQPFDEWLESSDAPEENKRRVRELMLQCVGDDRVNWKVRRERGQVLMTHQTLLVVAKMPTRAQA